MAKYIAKRLLQFIIVLLVSSVLIFALVRLSKTDPVAVILGGKQTSAETIANVRAKFNLDKPLVQQYFIWIGGMFKGNFGLSFAYQSDAGPLIAARLPITLGLVVMSSLIALILAIPLGILSAVKKNSLVDRGISVITLILVGCPAFLTSIVMILIISRVAPSYSFIGNYTDFASYLSRLSLPAVALSFVMIALASRITRASMIEQLDMPYAQTCRANGLTAKSIVWRHALKNSAIPVISVVSVQVGSMIVGAVLVEKVFSLAGVGTMLIDAITSSDYAITQDITLILIFVFLVISLIADILYAVIDPRVREK